MRRNPALIAVLVVVIAGALAGGATAFGRSTTQPSTAANYYASDMSLGEISRASRGEPGEVAPPCPEESVVTKLKASGLPVGPCDPLPESGAPIVLAEDAVEEAPATVDTCAAAFIGSTSPKDAMKVEGPCGPGAEILDVQPATNPAGIPCATVTYIQSAGATEQNSTVCEGDPADPNKPHVVMGVK